MLELKIECKIAESIIKNVDIASKNFVTNKNVFKMMIVVDIFLQVITNWRSLLKWTYVKQDIAEELNADCSRIVQNLQQTGKLEEFDKNTLIE